MIFKANASPDGTCWNSSYHGSVDWHSSVFTYKHDYLYTSSLLWFTHIDESECWSNDIRGFINDY